MFLAGLAACVSVNPTLPVINKVTTQAGHNVYYIPLDTETVTIRAAFPSNYLFTKGANPTVPHIGLQLIQQAGAGNIKPATLIEEFEKLDAEAELFAQSDVLRGKLVADIYEIEEAAKLANQVLTQSTLDEQWFRRIASNLSERAATDRVQSSVIGWNAMRYLSFDPQVARFWTASLDDIRAVTHKQIKEWYVQSFSSSDVLIVLSGPKDMASGLRAVDYLLEGLDQKSPLESTLEQQDFKPNARTILIENTAAQDALILMFDALKGEARAKEFETFMAVYDLGVTSESRLHRKLRDEMRATYDAYARFADFDRNVRLIAMGAQVAPEQAVEALNAASEVYNQIQATGLDQDEFNKIKTVYLDHFGSLLNEEDLPPNIVIETLLEGFEADQVNNLLPTLEAVDLRRQNEFIRKYLQPSEQLLRIIVAPNIDEIDLDVDCRVKVPGELSACT